MTKGLPIYKLTKILRMRMNGASISEMAHSVGMSRDELKSSLASYGYGYEYSTQEIEPKKEELIHISGGKGHLGFDLLPEDAQGLHEMRMQNGWYALNPNVIEGREW